jgi:hypothetical protein
MSSSSGRTLLIVLILLSAVLLAAGNLLCHALAVQELTGSIPATDAGLAQRAIRAVGQLIEPGGPFVWFFAGAPLVLGLMLAFVAAVPRGPRPQPAPAAAAAEAGDAGTGGALRLLALLQQEGRLIDFLEEEIEPYSDAQVGAAVRAIHAGCRQALHQRMEIARIFPQDDGASVEVAAGFDPAAVRLTGRVHGQPPFQGVLQHGGWRASQVRLPRTAGVDPAILAPAEVEIA